MKKSSLDAAADGDSIRFTNGTIFYANGAILGISEYAGKVDVTEGYDGSVDTEELTKAERRALARYAIALWRRFAKGK